MKRLIAVAAAMAAVATWIGCATPKNYKASLLPRGGGEQALTLTAATETDALEGAKREAQEFCEKAKKGYAVTSGPTVKYQGPDRGGATGVATTVASGLFGRDKSQDYRAEMTFKCE